MKIHYAFKIPYINHMCGDNRQNRIYKIEHEYSAGLGVSLKGRWPRMSSVTCMNAKILACPCLVGSNENTVVNWKKVVNLQNIMFSYGDDC